MTRIPRKPVPFSNDRRCQGIAHQIDAANAEAARLRLIAASPEARWADAERRMDAAAKARRIIALKELP
ncbi:MAG: hypothetical protein NVS2B11_17660 [Acetobacteraceae bacterium]